LRERVVEVGEEGGASEGMIGKVTNIIRIESGRKDKNRY
jgi:hypothetical protein